MKRTVSKWLSILSCTALLCTSIPAAFAEGTVEESLVPRTNNGNVLFMCDSCIIRHVVIH